MKPDRFTEILESLGGERRIHYTLDRFRSALAAVGNPQDNVHSLVIAGTNGKGTVSLLVTSTLLAAGHRVGTYLSPHLQHPRERFLDSLAQIDGAELTELAEEHLPIAHQFQLTYFEFLTLLCFVWAKRREFDFLVLEVGLGGRLDATNVTHPLACAITTIDWDHQEYLGNTLSAILDEKMGVLRPESLVFTGISDPSLVAQVERRCAELDGIAYYAHQLRTVVEEVAWSGQRVRFNDYPFTLSNPSVGTAQNAAVAFLMLRIVFPKLPMAILQEGFRRVVTPARMEVLQESPRVVLSGDHNPAGIRCLVETLDQLRVPKEKLRIVCAFSPDKPFREMVTALRERSADLLLTQVTRLRDKMPADYSTIAEKFEPDPTSAVKRMITAAAADETVVITGSLYLTGEVRPLWHSDVKFQQNTELDGGKGRRSHQPRFGRLMPP